MTLSHVLTFIPPVTMMVSSSSSSSSSSSWYLFFLCNPAVVKLFSFLCQPYSHQFLFTFVWCVLPLPYLSQCLLIFLTAKVTFPYLLSTVAPASLLFPIYSFLRHSLSCVLRSSLLQPSSFSPQVPSVR